MSDHAATEALNKAQSRALASAGTWFITEYPKLLIQSRPFSTTWEAYRSTSIQHHLRGASLSAFQRGSSAYIMFYGQSWIAKVLGSPTSNATANAGIAGFISGGASSLVHTIFEPMKIKHESFRFDVYSKALVPMFWRHALFDTAFFASNAALIDQPYSVQFGVSALAASCVNLTHDVWKTRFIQALPKRLAFVTVLRELSTVEYAKQLCWKSIDLGANWFATGVVYSHFFALR